MITKTITVEIPEKVTGLESYNLDSDVKWMTVKDEDIFIKGRIIGGCFDIISELAGTNYSSLDQLLSLDKHLHTFHNYFVL